MKTSVRMLDGLVLAAALLVCIGFAQSACNQEEAHPLPLQERTARTVHTASAEPRPDARPDAGCEGGPTYNPLTDRTECME